MPLYRVAPCTRCRAPAKTFTSAVAALLYAREASDGFRVAYSCYRCLAGNLLCLWTFRPDNRAA